MTSSSVAAIDCGTNSVRLLIAHADGLRERQTIVTGLGRGLREANRLQSDAIERTLEALSAYRTKLDALNIESVVAVTTEAVRRALNPEDFLKPAADIVRVPMRLIDGHEEARRSFAGAISDMDRSGELTLVVDIGGGSTELAVGARVAGVEPSVISLPMGSVVITEEFLHSDPPLAEELSNVFAVVDMHFEDAVRQVPEIASANRLIAVGGTACTVAAVEVGKSWTDESQHGFELTRAAMEDVFRTLATESLADRIFNPGLEAGRADVIVGGSAIMAATMRHFNFASCRISERDLLDSLVDDLLSLSLPS